MEMGCKGRLVFLSFLCAIWSPAWADSGEPAPDAASGNCAVVDAAKDAPFDNSKPQIIIDRWLRETQSKEYDCARDGVWMSGLAVYENGKWRDSFYRCEPSHTPYRDTYFARLGNSAKKYFPTGEIAATEINNVKGRAVVFKDMECLNGTEFRNDWWKHCKVFVTKPAWSSTVHPASSPPPLNELANRMKQDTRSREEETGNYCKGCADADCKDLCGPEGYDPQKLMEPEITEAVEFEIAPGEAVYFVSLRRAYPSREDDRRNASYWSTLVRKEGLEHLWSAWWFGWDEKTEKYYWPAGAADVNGDGISEVVITHNYYEGTTYTVYEYRDQKLASVFSEMDGS